MKRIITSASSTKLDKQQLRSEFISLATQIREMSKYEFVAILKNNELEIAKDWVRQLDDLHKEFQDQAASIVSYKVARIIVDDRFVGYVLNVVKDGSFRIIDATDDIEEAQRFVNANEVQNSCSGGTTIKVHCPGMTYVCERGYSNLPGVAGREAFSLNGPAVHVAHVDFDLEEV